MAASSELTLCVLAVDDEAGMLAGIERALRRFRVIVPDVDVDVGFELELAETGERAVEIIDERPPDIVLLDYKLPGINGLQVLDHLTRKGGDSLAIMITAYASIETAITATKQGAYDFLPKPFTPADLKHAVEKAASRIVLARRARELEESHRRVRFEFIRVLGHELKAPLAAIEGYLRIVEGRIAGDELSAYDKMIERSLARVGGMHKLIGDLLDLTRIESGQKVRELSSVDVTEAARTGLETVAPAATEANITVALHAEGPVEIMGDRGELDIVFNNLLSNAVKYNVPDGRVDVTIEPVGDGVRIVVEDTGLGMSEEQLGRLFEEFVRFKTDRTRHIEGSGLGMSILKRLIGLYDGEIDVSSEPGVGTRFAVLLKDLQDS